MLPFLVEKQWNIWSLQCKTIAFKSYNNLSNVTCSHEMIDKSRHAVPRFSLKTVVGVNLGEIEIFALCHSSFIFTPYKCSFLLYSTHKCFKFCKWSTYWSIRHWEMTPKWPIFTEGLLSVTRAEPHVSHTKTKVTVSRCELLTWLFEIIQ